MQVSLQLLLLLAAGYAFQSCPSICTCKWKNGKLDNKMWTKFHQKIPYIVRNTEGMVFSYSICLSICTTTIQVMSLCRLHRAEMHEITGKN